MMESDRVRVLSEYEQRDTTKRFERLKGAQVLHQQIEENEQTRLLEQEKKDQETKVNIENFSFFILIFFYFKNIKYALEISLSSTIFFVG